MMADEKKSARHEEVWGRVKLYIPFLQELISYYKNSSQQNRQQQLQKLTTMYELLTNKKLNSESLCKCEKVLQKLYETNPLKREIKLDTSQPSLDTPASPSSPDPPAKEPTAADPERVEKSGGSNKNDGPTGKVPLSLDEIQRLITEKNESSNVRAAINNTLNVLKGARIPTITCDGSLRPSESALSQQSHYPSDYWQTESETFDTFPHAVNKNYRPVSYNNIDLTPGPSKSPPLYRRREDLAVQDTRTLNERMDISPADDQSRIKDPRLRKSAAFTNNLPTPPDPVFPPKSNDPRLNRPVPLPVPPPNDLPKCIAPNPNLPLQLPKRRLSICANQVIIEEIPPEPVIPVKAFPVRRPSTCSEIYDRSFQNAQFIPPPPSMPTPPVLTPPITPVYPLQPPFVVPQPTEVPSLTDRDPRRNHLTPGSEFTKPPQSSMRNAGSFSNTPMTYAEYRRQKEMRESLANERNKSEQGEEYDRIREQEKKTSSEAESTIGMVPNNNRVAAKAYAKPAKCFVQKERRFAPQSQHKDKDRGDMNGSKPYSHDKKRDPRAEKDKVMPVPKSKDLFGEQLSQFDKMYRSGDFSKKSTKPNIDKFKIPKIRRVENQEDLASPNEKHKNPKDTVASKASPTAKEGKTKSTSMETSHIFSKSNKKKQKENSVTKPERPDTKASTLADDDLWDDDVPLARPESPKPIPQTETKTVQKAAEKPVFQAPSLPAPRRIMTRRYSMAIERKNVEESKENEFPSASTSMSPVVRKITRRRNSIAVPQPEKKIEKELEKPKLPDKNENVGKQSRRSRKRRVIFDDDDDDDEQASSVKGMQSKQDMPEPEPDEPPVDSVVVTAEDTSDNVVSSTTSESCKVSESIVIESTEVDNGGQQTSDSTNACENAIANSGGDELKPAQPAAKDDIGSSPDNKAQLLAMLSTMLDEKKLKKIREIIESPADKSTPNEQDLKKADNTMPDEQLQELPNDQNQSEESEHHEEPAAVANELREKEKVNRKGKRNEVDKLNADIAEMFIRDGVLTAYGRRSCTIKTPDPPKRFGPGPSKVAKPASSKKVTEEETSKTTPTKRKSDLEVTNVPPAKEKSDLRSRLRNFQIVVKKLNIEELGVDVETVSKRIEDDLEDDVVSVASSGVSVSPKSKKRKRSVWAVGLVKRKKKKLATKEQNNAASSPIKTYAPKPVTKNTYRDLHCSNVKSKNCALCFYVGPLSTIVQHYVRNHPLHEVYTSRVPNFVANKLKKEPMRVSGRIHDQNITFQCIFCQEELSKTKYNWKLHLASHTGEYRYKCTNCTIKSLTPCTYSHDSECSGSSMEVVNELLFEENHIFAYMCRLCNFVQLSRDKMKAHLREEHERQVTGKGTLQFSVLNYALDDKPCESPKSQESPLESDVSMPELTPQAPNQKQLSDMSAFIPTANEEIESLRVLNDRTLISPPKSSIVDKMIDRINATQTSNDDDWEDIDSPVKEAKNGGVSSEKVSKVRRSLHTFEEVLLPQTLEQQDEEPADVFKDRQMVSNVGYNKISDAVWYLCLIGGCKYSTLIRSEMYSHVSEQHSSITWDGFCHLCTAQVIEDDSSDLCKEVKHMAFIHIKDRSAIDDLNTSVTSIMPPPVPIEDGSTKLKLRRFSGDKLSIGTPPLDQVQLDSEVAPNVKPWLNAAATKQRNHCLNMLEPKSLYCFYKCMATSCCFTTPLETMMEKHLDNHELVGDATGSITSRSWLECAYCEVVSETTADLLRHLKAVHTSSTHQCAYCFYRSRDAYSVILHQKLHHTKAKPQILVMDLAKKPLLINEQETLNRRRFENIVPLICTVCEAKFCVLDAFMTHLKEIHADMKTVACQCCQELVLKQKIPRHLLVHKIGIYECIYCQYGTDTIDAIQIHVCNKHPMEPFYCCVRFNKATGKVMEATLKSLYDKAIEEHVFVCCPFTQEELSYKSADTKSNHDISHGTKPTVIPLQLPPIRVGNANILLSAQIPSSSSSSEVAVPSQAVMVNRQAVIKIPTISSVSGGVALPAPTSVPVITAVHENYQPAATSPAISTSMPVISKVVGGVAATTEALAGGSSSMPVITRVEGGVPAVATVKPVPSLQVPAQDESLMLEAERIALEMIKDTGLPKTHLYRCIFKGCTQPVLPDGMGMRNHLMYCHIQAGQYVCSHCKKQNTFTTVATFIQHLKSHEAQRVFCFVCDYKGSFPPDVMKHVKEVHKASKPAMLYLNPQKNNPNNDIILFAPGVPTEADKKAYYRKLIDLYNHKLQIALLQQKTHFAPEECEALPKQAIFSQTIFCSKCQYSTKVRQNMYRHLKGHLNDLPVSNVDPKNPVPCWGQGEKHFDRMRNPAASSQEDDDLIQSLCFVQESKRYICGAPDCRHLTINELMLQNHLVTLHGDVKEYKCPHCPAVHMFAGKLNTSKVLDHLKLHDKELYRCSVCQIFLNNSKEMNHIAEKHPKTANATLLVIRDGSTAGSVAGSSADHEVLFKWKCDICKFKSVSLAEIRTHMQETHNTDSKYRCSRCLFSCSKKASFATHFEKQHPGCDIVIISLYKQIDGDDSRADTTPLWRREVSKTRSIRGIMLETDDNEDDEDEEEFVEVNSLASPGLAATGVTIRKRKSLEDEKEPNVAIKRPKPEEVAVVKAFKCGFKGCAYMDDFGAGIVSHFKSVHPNEKPSVLRNSMANPAQSRFDYFLKYACYYCIRKADTIHDLLDHWRQMHRISGPKSQDKPFLFRASKIILCFYCRKGAQMPEMKSHYTTYHPDKQPIYLDFRNPKQCAECDFVMVANRQEMVEHFAVQHKVENEYSRGWIDFLTDDILDKILKLNSAMYGCGKCSFASAKPSDFEAHYAAAHPGQSVAFNEYPLIQHITYHCAYNNCKSQLTDERSMAQHLLFHVPVFKCCCLSGGVQCNVQFRTITMLVEHFKTTHPNEAMRYALKTPEEYKHILRMITLQFWNGFMMTLEDARQAGNRYGSNDGIFKLVNQMCQEAVHAETRALQQ